MKRIAIIFAVLSILLAPGCTKTAESEYARYTDSFFDTFDTLVIVTAYTKSEAEFKAYFELIKGRFQELHRLYDIYNSYEGINNLKTINDRAGQETVEVEQEIIDLILFAKEWHGRTHGRVNIALGPVLQIWHRYRTEGLDDPQNAALPPLELLQKARERTDLEQVIVDPEKGTVYLAEPGMSLDVGAIAKGYAAELAAREAAAAGLSSGLISAGGNVRVIGRPLDGVRERWAIGIQEPEASIFGESDNLLDTIFINDGAVVSSGDYQRYYTEGGKRYHHLIDPETLMPADHYRAVTVVAGDSAVADYLSTELFLLPYAESRALADSLDGVEAIWVMPDGEVKITRGLEAMLKSRGATNVNP